MNETTRPNHEALTTNEAAIPFFGKPYTTDAVFSGVHPSPPSYEEQEADLEALRAACFAVHEGTLAALENPITPEGVSRFLSEEAPHIVLPPELQRKIDAWPDQLPGVTTRMALFNAANPPREQFLPCSEIMLRAASFEDVPCSGRDIQIKAARKFLMKSGPRTLILRGAPGVGKTILAKAIANHIANSEDEISKLSLSNIHFFDCVGLSTPSELISLLASQLLTGRLPQAPIGQAERICLLKKRLSSTGGPEQPLLWVFDGLDSYLTERSEKPLAYLANLLTHFAEAANQLKLIVTVRRVAREPALRRLFAKRQVHIETVELIQDECNESHRNGFVDSVNTWHHPLASLLLDAAKRLLIRRPILQLPLSVADGATILEETCRGIWSELTTADQNVLRFLAELPGGVWVTESNATFSRPEDIDWFRVFKEPNWMSIINRLRGLEWVTQASHESGNLGPIQQYRLRPALRRLVAQFTEAHLRNKTRAGIVYFWACRLKCWSRIVSGHLLERAETRLIGGHLNPLRVRPEEYAHGLLDLNRLNWLHAFRRIPEVAHHGHRRNNIILHKMFLRGTISYCRLTGLQSLFMGMVDRAISEIKHVDIAKSERPTWRTIVYQVYLVSCYGMQGRTHQRLGDLKTADNSLRIAEDKLRFLPESAPYVRRELAWTLTQLGNALHALGLWAAAESKLREAIDLRRTLLAESESQLTRAMRKLTSEYRQSDAARAATAVKVFGRRVRMERRYLATSLNIHGSVLTARFDGKGAQAAQQEALAIRQELAAELPICFQRYLAKSLNDLGNALFYQHQFASAIIYYEEALAIRERLVPYSELALSQYVARTCNNLGNTFRKLGRWEDAVSHLERAVQIYRVSASEYALSVNELLARTLSSLGRVYYHQGRLKKAVATLEESDRLHMLAYERASKTPPFDWIENCNYLAMAYLQSQLISYASVALQKTNPLLSRGEDVCWRNAMLLRAYTNNTKAKILTRSKNTGDWEAAESLLLESEALRLKVKREVGWDPAVELEFAETWHNLGCVLGKMQRQTEAICYLTDALELRRQIAEGNPEYMSRLIARSATELAGLYAGKGRLDEARCLYSEAETLFAELVNKCPEGFTRELERVRVARCQLDNDSMARGPGSLRM